MRSFRSDFPSPTVGTHRTRVNQPLQLSSYSIGTDLVPATFHSACSEDRLQPRNHVEGENDRLAGEEKPYVYRDFSRLSQQDIISVCPSFANLGIERVLSSVDEDDKCAQRRLPEKLAAMLSDSEIEHIVTWMPHGRAWKILRSNDFIDEVIPKYFQNCQYNSFIRLVNAWGFRRISSGIDQHAYYHELFLQGMPHLHRQMRRLRKNDKKAQADFADEPNFYDRSKFPPLPSLEEQSAMTSTYRVPTLVQPGVGTRISAATMLNPLRNALPLQVVPQNQCNLGQSAILINAGEPATFSSGRQELFPLMNHPIPRIVSQTFHPAPNQVQVQCFTLPQLTGSSDTVHGLP